VVQELYSSLFNCHSLSVPAVLGLQMRAIARDFMYTGLINSTTSMS